MEEVRNEKLPMEIRILKPPSHELFCTVAVQDTDRIVSIKEQLCDMFPNFAKYRNQMALKQKFEHGALVVLEDEQTIDEANLQYGDDVCLFILQP